LNFSFVGFGARRKRHGEEITKIVDAEKAVFLDLGDSKVENTRQQRLQVAQFYVEERPDAVITWGLNNSHPDHRYTGYLALDAIKFARINKLVDADKPHRKNVKLLHYYETQSSLPTKYVDLTESSMEKAKLCADFYADIYEWKNVEAWTIDRRRAYGLE